jgi:hypothetical protein
MPCRMPARRWGAGWPRRPPRRGCLPASPDVFGIEKPPRRIEIYDNSHIMGTNAVGGMVVAGPEGFVKNQYRKFNIRSTDITPGDDFGMMKRGDDPALLPPHQGSMADCRTAPPREGGRGGPALSRPGPTSSSSTAARAR